MTKDMPVVFGYVRVSTQEQSVSGLGLEAQTQSIRAHVAAHGGALAQLHTDAGLSGTLPPSKRPGLARLLVELERAPRGKTTLLVCRLDRLGRSAREVLNLEYELRRRGVRLESITEALDSTSPAGRAYLSLLATFAEFEAGLAAERTTAAMRASVTKDGARVGGPTPLGYGVDQQGSYVVVEAEAMVVCELFAAFLLTKSFAASARALNDRCLFGRAGVPWSHVTVADVVRRAEVYRGVRLWARWSRKLGPRDPCDWVRLAGAHEAIIDAATAELVTAILDRRSRRRAARRQAALPAQPTPVELEVGT